MALDDYIRKVVGSRLREVGAQHPGNFTLLPGRACIVGRISQYRS